MSNYQNEEEKRSWADWFLIEVGQNNFKGPNYAQNLSKTQPKWPTPFPIKKGGSVKGSTWKNPKAKRKAAQQVKKKETKKEKTEGRTRYGK